MRKYLFIALLLTPFYSGAQLQVVAGTRIRMGDSTHLVLHNLGVNNAGNINQDSGTFRFTGAQSVQFVSTVPVLFYNWEISKVSAASHVKLFQDISISNELRFVQGLLDLNNNRVDLGSSGNLVNENNNGRAIGENGGEIQSTRILETPTNVNPGNLGFIITSKQNLGTITVQRGHQSQSNGSGNGNSIQRYYDLLQSNPTSFEASVKMNYFESELNGLDENTLVFWKSVDNLTWTNEGFNERSNTLNYVQIIGIDGFSRWTLSSAVNALPVTGLRLSGRWNSNASDLKWITTSEYNNRHFEIERRYAGESDFNAVAIVRSLHPDGNYQGISRYSYRDVADAGKGNIMYRLKQVDIDGNVQYSNIISIRPSSPEMFINRIYPTIGVDRSLYIQAGSLDLAQADLMIIDISGKLLVRKKIKYESQWITLPNLARGTYRLQINSGTWTYQSVFFKN